LEKAQSLNNQDENPENGKNYDNKEKRGEAGKPVTAIRSQPNRANKKRAEEAVDPPNM